LPDDAYTDQLEDIIEWLGALIRATDSTLLDEWTLLAGKPVHDHEAPEALTGLHTGPPAAWRTAVRTAMFGWVELLARRAYPLLAERCGWDEARLRTAMAPYWAEYDGIAIDAEARAQRYVRIVDEPGQWRVEQTLVDPAGDGEWRLTAVVDLAQAELDGAPTLRLHHLGSLADT
jgi:hypothetical protein